MTYPNENIVDVPTSKSDEDSFKTPKSELLRMHLTHLGKILSNISIVALILSLGGIFSSLLYGISVILLCIGWVLVIIFTLGGIFLIAPNYGSFFNSGFFDNFNPLLGDYIFVILGISLACAIASIILLAFDKHDNHKGRIIFSSIVLVSTLIILIAIIGGAL